MASGLQLSQKWRDNQKKITRSSVTKKLFIATGINSATNTKIKYYYGDQIKENGRGGTCGTYEDKTNTYSVLVGKYDRKKTWNTSA